MQKYSTFMDGKTKYFQVSVLPNLIYRFNGVPIKITESYFLDTDQLILKFIGKHKWLRIAKSTLKEKYKVGRLIIPNFKIYSKAKVKKKKSWSD